VATGFHHESLADQAPGTHEYLNVEQGDQLVQIAGDKRGDEIACEAAMSHPREMAESTDVWAWTMNVAGLRRA
jgi:hypothetical protein